MSKQKQAMYSLHFDNIPVNEVGVSADGIFFNMPFYHRGGKFFLGNKSTEAVISKGRIIIRTAKGREALDNEAPKAKTPKVNVADLF